MYEILGKFGIIHFFIPSISQYEIFKLLLLAATLVLSSTDEVNGSSQVKCIERERLALLSFKQGLLGFENLLTSWRSSNKDCCTWRGIRCNNLTNHVIKLDLRPYFTYFDNFYNWSSMTVEIGSSLVELHHLEHLDLSCNIFTKIPKFLGFLTRLRYLNISQNSIAGNIPSQLRNLTKLCVLDLSYNAFTKIPKFIGSFTRLRYLNLFQNPIVGNIPSQLGNLTKLRVLDLSGNFMTTDSFEWFSHLHYLRIFKLGSTNSTEAMDWFQSFKIAPFLFTLELSYCQFPLLESSSLPHINTSNSPRTLNVYGGTLKSVIVSHLLNLSNNLVDLNILHLHLDGPLPNSFKIPNSFENLKSLRRLLLNGFVCEVPKSLGNLCNLQELVLFDNKFNSTLDDILESCNTCYKDPLETLCLSSNALQGPFSNVEKFPISLRELTVGGNILIGPLPDILKMSSLREIDVSKNKLNGSLPESISKLSNLEVLEVSMNSFTGVISEAHLGNLSKLQHLDLSSNSLTLKLPFNWFAPFQLEYLDLGSCISGPQFPSWLQTQSNISFLNLSSSGITNAIPNWFFNLTYQFI